MLKRRGVISSTVERSPGHALSAEDRQEISILLEQLADQIQVAAFGAE